MGSFGVISPSAPSLQRAIESWHRAACLTDLPANIGPLVDVDAQTNRVTWSISDSTRSVVPLNATVAMARVRVGIGSLGIVEGVRTYVRVTAMTEFGAVEMPVRDGVDPSAQEIAHPTVGVAPLVIEWALVQTARAQETADFVFESWSDDRHGWNRGQVDERQLASTCGDVVLLLTARTESPESWTVRATGELAGYTQLFGTTKAAEENAKRRA